MDAGSIIVSVVIVAIVLVLGVGSIIYENMNTSNDVEEVIKKSEEEAEGISKSVSENNKKKKKKK